MKKLIATLACVITAVSGAFADPPETRQLDFQYATAPALQVYQANTKTFQWTIKRNNSTFNGTGYTPYMYIASSNRASSIVTAACSWVTQTIGVFNASFSASQLNTNGSWIYGAGVTSGEVTTIRQGNFVLTPDPYASGAGAIELTTPMDMSLYTYSNTTNGPYIAGSNVLFRSVGSRGQVLVDAVASSITNGLASVSYVDSHTGLQATAHGGVVLQSTTGNLGVAYSRSSATAENARVWYNSTANYYFYAPPTVASEGYVIARSSAPESSGYVGTVMTNWIAHATYATMANTSSNLVAGYKPQSATNSDYATTANIASNLVAGYKPETSTNADYSTVANTASNLVAGYKVQSATNSDYSSVANTASNLVSGYKPEASTNSDYSSVANLASNVNSVVSASTSSTYAAYANISSNYAGPYLTSTVVDANVITASTVSVNGSITVPNATQDGQATPLNQVVGLIRSNSQGNLTLYYTPTRITGTMYTNNISPTGEVYSMNCTGDIGVTSIRTNAAAAVGAYFSANVCTGTTYTTFDGQSINIEKYISENDAGAAYVIEEVYRFEPSSSNWIEWGQAVSSNLVASGTTPTKMNFAVQVGTIVTNVPWMIGTRGKKVAGGTSHSFIVGSGSNYPSHVTVGAPIDVVTADLLKLNGTRAMTGNLNGGGQSATNFTSVVTTYATGTTVAAAAITSGTAIVSGLISGGGNIDLAGKIGVGTNNPVYAVDVIGQIHFLDAGSRGSGFAEAGVGLTQFGDLGTNAVSLYAGGDRVYVAPSGNVGIGTNVPGAKLHVAGDMLVTNVQCGSITQSNVSATNYFSANTGFRTTTPLACVDICPPLGADTYGAHALRFTAGNNSGYGWCWNLETSANGDSFYMRITNSVTNCVMSFERATGYVGLGIQDPGHLLHLSGGAYCDGTGDWIAGSDITYKRAITSLPCAKYGVKEILQLVPVEYIHKKDPKNRVQLGLIANDVVKVIPEVVDGEPGSYGIAYNRLIPVIINAIREQDVALKNLTARIAALEKVAAPELVKPVDQAVTEPLFKTDNGIAEVKRIQVPISWIVKSKG